MCVVRCLSPSEDVSNSCDNDDQQMRQRRRLFLDLHGEIVVMGPSNLLITR